jgi:hypothetical protein
MSVLRAVKRFYNDKEKRGWDKGYFFFDIHGTILKPNYQYGNTPKDFYPYAVETLQFLTKLPDVEMIIYTCSHPHEIQEYIKLFADHGITFKFVNENPEVPTQVDGYGCYDKKPYMNVLFEDKAGFDPETEWREVLDFIKAAYANEEK